MPEARDRISRPVDIAALFARRRTTGVGILADEPEDGAELFRSPARQQQQQQQQATPAAARTVVRTPADFGATTTRGGRGGGVASAPRIGSWRGRYFNENSAVAGSARRGRGRGRSSVLPSWYPRTPLRDITVIARAIERRRARLRDGEGQGSESPVPEDLGILDPSASKYVTTERQSVATSPRSSFRSKPYPLSVGKVPKILLGIANQNTAESDCLTPQKKLLNSIDSVEKVVMEELQKLKRTPTAKKAEREKRVRTLMSMR